MLKFYDKDFNIISSDPIRSAINGLKGGAKDILLYVRNDDISVYYRDLLLVLDSKDGKTGYLTDDSNGVYVKFLSGQDQPNEREWDLVLPAESIPLDDIGDREGADTHQYHPFWVRIYVPGNSSVGFIDIGSLRLYFTEVKVTGYE